MFGRAPLVAAVGGLLPQQAVVLEVVDLCKTCHTNPHRAGGAQCEDCFQADRDALNLVFTELGATPVDPES